MDNENFSNEVLILKSLRHPNVVLFMGIAMHQNGQYIITELMSGGSLDTFIKPKSLRSSAIDVENLKISFVTKVVLLKHVCRGMIYVHSLNPVLCHRDLKPS
jgi:serine/threonine protein kinase